MDLPPPRWPGVGRRQFQIWKWPHSSATNGSDAGGCDAGGSLPQCNETYTQPILQPLCTRQVCCLAAKHRRRLGLSWADRLPNTSPYRAENGSVEKITGYKFVQAPSHVDRASENVRPFLWSICLAAASTLVAGCFFGQSYAKRVKKPNLKASSKNESCTPLLPSWAFKLAGREPQHLSCKSSAKVAAPLTSGVGTSSVRYLVDGLGVWNL